MPTYEYQCEECGLITDAIHKISERDTEEVCSHCGGKAHFVISAPMFKLEGVSGDYPTAYDKWAKTRRQKQNQERKAEGKPPLTY